MITMRRTLFRMGILLMIAAVHSSPLPGQGQEQLPRTDDRRIEAADAALARSPKSKAALQRQGPGSKNGEAAPALGGLDALASEPTLPTRPPSTPPPPMGIRAKP